MLNKVDTEESEKDKTNDSGVDLGSGEISPPSNDCRQCQTLSFQAGNIQAQLEEKLAENAELKQQVAT